jgi:hypothetical protein
MLCLASELAASSEVFLLLQAKTTAKDGLQQLLHGQLSNLVHEMKRVPQSPVRFGIEQAVHSTRRRMLRCWATSDQSAVSTSNSDALFNPIPARVQLLEHVGQLVH